MTKLKPCAREHKSLWEASHCEECMRLQAYESLKRIKVTENGKPWIHPENRRVNG
jgi:hypothetical protein